MKKILLFLSIKNIKKSKPVETQTPDLKPIDIFTVDPNVENAQNFDNVIHLTVERKPIEIFKDAPNLDNSFNKNVTCIYRHPTDEKFLKWLEKIDNRVSFT